MDVLDDAPCGEDDVLCEEEDVWCGEEDIACGVPSGEGRFSYSERTNGLMLTDKHIYAATKLLMKQFPHLQGLQSTLLSQKKSFFN